MLSSSVCVCGIFPSFFLYQFFENHKSNTYKVGVFVAQKRGKPKEKFHRDEIFTYWLLKDSLRNRNARTSVIASTTNRIKFGGNSFVKFEFFLIFSS